MAIQPAVEKVALELWQQDPELAIRFLTDHSVGHAEVVVRCWKDLAVHLITRYNDGYVIEPDASSERGYPDDWLREVIRRHPDRYRLVQPEAAETALPY